MPMALEKMSFVETDWYVTQEGDKRAKDFIFKDFCDYIIVIKTFGKLDVTDISDILSTKIIHIDSNNGNVSERKYDELDPPLKEILTKSNFPLAHDKPEGQTA